MIFVLELEKNVKTSSRQENRCSCSNMSVDELKQAFDDERKEYEKKLEKLIKSQLDPLTRGKRSNDLEVALSKLRAERDEYLYEINCLKKLHNKEVNNSTIRFTQKWFELFIWTYKNKTCLPLPQL